MVSSRQKTAGSRQDAADSKQAVTSRKQAADDKQEARARTQGCLWSLRTASDQENAYGVITLLVSTPPREDK
jgi:hypothetical protein